MGTRENNNSHFLICNETRTNTDIEQEQEDFEENVVYEDEPLPFPNEIYTVTVSNAVLGQETHVEENENDVYLFDNNDSYMYEDYAAPQSVSLDDITRIESHERTQDIQNDQYANTEMPKASVIEIYAVTHVEQEPTSNRMNHEPVTKLLYKGSTSKKSSENTYNEFSKTMVPLSSPSGIEEQTQYQSVLITAILKVSETPSSSPNYKSPETVMDQLDQEESIAPPNTPPPELPIKPPPPLPDNAPQELPMVPPRQRIMTPVFNGNENIGSLIKQSEVDFGRTNVLFRNSGDELPIMPSPVTREQMPSNGQGHRYSYDLDVKDQQHELLDSEEVVRNNHIQESDGDVEGNESEQTYDIPKKFKHVQSMS